MNLLSPGLFLVGISCFQIVAAQGDEAENSGTTFEDQLPYEIVITPTISRLDLRNLIEKVEADFFNRFNELNEDDEYDVLCYRYTPTMSHISKRRCEPVFVIRTRGDIASEATFRLGTSGAFAAGSRSSAFVLPPKGMRREVEPQFEILEEIMRDLNGSDAELKSIGSVLAELKWQLKNFSNR